MINIKKIIETLNKKASFRTQEGYITRKSFAERKKEKNDKFIQGVLEDLEANHNHSWFEELYLRNEQTLDDIALFYRGTEVTYGEMFEHMKAYAKALRQQGVEKGTEIPICISNTPELVYLLGAISMVGAKANIFNEEFDPEYITEIIDGCNSEIMFVEDGKYEELKESIERSHISNIVMTSLTDSLPKTSNLYEEYDKKHGKFVNTVEEHKYSEDMTDDELLASLIEMYSDELAEFKTEEIIHKEESESFKKKKKKEPVEVVRYTPSAKEGLTTEQVIQRKEDGHVNVVSNKNTKTYSTSTDVSDVPISNYAKRGNGYAKITLVNSIS